MLLNVFTSDSKFMNILYCLKEQGVVIEQNVNHERNLNESEIVDENSELREKRKPKTSNINVQSTSADSLIPVTVKETLSTWGDSSIKMKPVNTCHDFGNMTKEYKWNQQQLKSTFTNRWGTEALNIVNKMTGWYANAPKPVTQEIPVSKNTLKSVPQTTIDEKWMKPGWGRNIHDKTDTP